MAADAVVKELWQLWRLSQYIWQQKQHRLLLLSSLLISITVMSCMASSVLPIGTTTPHRPNLIGLNTPIELTKPFAQKLPAHNLSSSSSQRLEAAGTDDNSAEISSASQTSSGAVNAESSSNQPDTLAAVPHDAAVLAEPSSAFDFSSRAINAESSSEQTDMLDPLLHDDAVPAEPSSAFEISSGAVNAESSSEQTDTLAASLDDAAVPAVPAAAVDTASEHVVHRRMLQTNRLLPNTHHAHLANTDHSRAAAAEHDNMTSNRSLDGPVRLKPSAKLKGMVASSSRAFVKPGKFPVQRDDLVAAIPTDFDNRPLTDGSKIWRQDMRTYLVVNTSYVFLEQPVADTDTDMWRSWRDDNETFLTGWCEPWDPRVALTPFLAHRDFHGEYKWMLFGHDDTFFFVNNVLELLQDFDPDLPYVITDHFWWTDEPLKSANPQTNFYHSSEYAPHCMPCHWDKEEEQRALQGRTGNLPLPFPPYPGCPCTLEHICKSDKRGFFETPCNAPLKPLPVRVQIGAGALISRGFLEKVPLAFMEQCILDLPAAPRANALFSHCIQQAGYAFTSPGHAFYHWDAKSFDPGPLDSQMHPGPLNSLLLLHAFRNASLGTADEVSRELVSHVISAHMEGLTLQGAAHTMLQLQSSYDHWQDAVVKMQR
ncbi:hypothetical protein ABBQ32_003149 [Trebouxia sp. C0010 RCD-2024]